MNAFLPSIRGIYFAKIRGFKVTDYTSRTSNPSPCRWQSAVSCLLITHRAHQPPPERTAIALRQASPHDILALPRRQSISAVSKYTHKPRAEQIYLLARSVSSRTGGRSLIDARGGAGVQAARLAGTLTSPAKAHLPRPERIKTEPSAIRSHG